jgi:hemolysin activation/secretion protein
MAMKGKNVKIKLLAATMLALSHGATAQQIPTGGGQLQQIPAMDERNRAAPIIRIEQVGGEVGGGRGRAGKWWEHRPAAQVTVNSLHTIGQTIYQEGALLALTGFTPGGKLSLGELQAMAAKIANYYRKKGHFVAQAYLPTQQISGGAVTIAVEHPALPFLTGAHP